MGSGSAAPSWTRLRSSMHRARADPSFPGSGIPTALAVEVASPSEEGALGQNSMDATLFGDGVA
eukprot:15443031-Alexandrium_andersonii.AAC.1